MTQESLIIKDVDFEGQKLKSAQVKSTQEIYVGVRWVCEGIGLSNGQSRRQVQNIPQDIVLAKGITNLRLHTDGGEQDVLCINIDFLPLWLAKISITPKMRQDNPTVVNSLIEYQLKAKDVLAKAFIYDNSNNSELFSKLLSVMEKNNNLLEENNQLRPKADMCDKFLDSKGYISLNKTAKGLKLGRNKMMAFLRIQSVLFKDGNDTIPYQTYINRGYFTIDYTVGRDGITHATTRVSSRGVAFIHKLYQKYATERTVA